jgi:hypothetical protein
MAVRDPSANRNLIAFAAWSGFAHAALMGVQAFRNLVARGAQNRERILAARILMVLSASIFFTLGVVHLVYTFWGTKLTPRDPVLQISMSQISPVITKETTMCGVGWASMPATAWDLFCSAWFSVFSHWLTANSSFSHRFCSLSGWQCLVVLLCSASFIFSMCL